MKCGEHMLKLGLIDTYFKTIHHRVNIIEDFKVHGLRDSHGWSILLQNMLHIVCHALSSINKSLADLERTHSQLKDFGTGRKLMGRIVLF
ncbi:hypothetical protein KSP39_PZI007718 [Platanthera zijinensis]|uniref:Uncharacterized protein n=1 Tax=Platanthera zijinensis TaxID=2320716 RepID=A0AAP0BN65_9ASPA